MELADVRQRKLPRWLALGRPPAAKPPNGQDLVTYMMGAIFELLHVPVQPFYGQDQLFSHGYVPFSLDSMLV
jgi:hypothetical protein